jgi:hypothetical protein
MRVKGGDNEKEEKETYNKNKKLFAWETRKPTKSGAEGA